MEPEEPHSSELGTKEFWDAAYERELDNFKDYGDVGEIWFGRQIEKQIVHWIVKNFRPGERIIDIGCGNGHLLVTLATKHGFTSLTGVDYVDKAISLAKSLASDRDVLGSIDFRVWDILSSRETFSNTLGNLRYAVVIDKGTYDAISLMPAPSIIIPTSNKNNANDYGGHVIMDHRWVTRKAYIDCVVGLLTGPSVTHGASVGSACSRSDDGCQARFLITSCNWTRGELLAHFDAVFELVEELPTPKMSFGGREGRTATSLILKMKAKYNMQTT